MISPWLKWNMFTTVRKEQLLHRKSINSAYWYVSRSTFIVLLNTDAYIYFVIYPKCWSPTEPLLQSQPPTATACKVLLKTATVDCLCMRGTDTNPYDKTPYNINPSINNLTMTKPHYPTTKPLMPLDITPFKENYLRFAVNVYTVSLWITMHKITLFMASFCVGIHKKLDYINSPAHCCITQPPCVAPSGDCERVIS